MIEDLSGLADKIKGTSYKGRRRLVAITGAPACGKSTIAERLQRLVPNSCVVPMDGFHLDNSVLDARGHRNRKGAPHTFDVDGFAALIETLNTAERMRYPVFDRTLDQAVKGVGRVGPDIDTVLVEGNYLLLNAGGWPRLHRHWDFSITLDVPLEELERRLLARWTSLGLKISEAEIKTYTNDLPNARTVIEQSIKADVIV